MGLSTAADAKTKGSTNANVKAGDNYNQVAVDKANATAIDKANDHSALILKDASVSTVTTVTVNNTSTTGQSTSNKEDNLGTKVAVIAKDQSTTGTDKEAAIKTQKYAALFQ